MPPGKPSPPSDGNRYLSLRPVLRLAAWIFSCYINNGNCYYYAPGRTPCQVCSLVGLNAGSPLVAAPESAHRASLALKLLDARHRRSYTTTLTISLQSAGPPANTAYRPILVADLRAVKRGIARLRSFRIQGHASRLPSSTASSICPGWSITCALSSIPFTSN